MVETELSFFEVQVEGVFWQAVELSQAVLGIAPEGFDAVDVRSSVGEFIAAVVDAQVLGVAHVDQAIVARPTVGMDDAVQVDVSSNGFAQSVFLHVGDDLGVDAVTAFEHAEDDGLVPGAASTFTPDPSWAEVGFIDFYFPPEGALGFTVLGDAASQLEVDIVDASYGKARQLGRIGGGQVHGKDPQQMPEYLLTDSGTDVVLVFTGNHRTKSSLTAA